MKKVIVLLLALTFATIFVAPAMAKRWNGELCDCEANCQQYELDWYHAQGHPLCVMPQELPHPYGNAAAQCLKECILNGSATD